MTEMERAIQHLVSKGFQPKVVLDVGAAKGYWSQIAGYYFPGAEFFMIDPLAESEPNLQSLCAADARFHYVLTSVSSEPGTAVLNVTPDLDGSSLCSWEGEEPERQRHVPVTTVDKLLAEGRIKPPDLVKIDVQGYELKVLQGGQKMFAHAEVFIVETNLYVFMRGCARVHEVVDFMAARDCYLFDIAGSLRRPYQDDLGQLDLVFVARRSPLGSSNRWA